MNIVVENTNCKTITVPQLLDMVGDNVRAKWRAIGDMDSKIHWQYGAEADALISEGYPAMVVYKAIAIEAGKSSQTVRKAYCTYASFTADQRKKYELCPYSVFAHARTQKEPESVLQYYLDNRASVDEIEAVYPENSGDEFDVYFNVLGYPRIYYGIMREAYGLPQEKIEKIAVLLDGITKIINEAYK